MTEVEEPRLNIHVAQGGYPALVLNADFPRLKKHQLPADQQKQNDALAEAYNKKGSFPLTVLLDAHGHVLKEWEGVAADSPENFIAQIENVPHAR